MILISPNRMIEFVVVGALIVGIYLVSLRAPINNFTQMGYDVIWCNPKTLAMSNSVTGVAYNIGFRNDGFVVWKELK